MKIIQRVMMVWMCLALVGCSNGNSQNDTESTRDGTEFLMNTIMTISLKDHGTQENLDQLFDVIRGIENKVSSKIATSEIAQINDAAGIEAVKVSEDTYYMIETAIHYGALSQGQFDITLGPVIDLWQIGTDEAHIPEQNLLDEALKSVDYQKIQLDKQAQTVFLMEKGMAIELGAIAKGYAADAVVEKCKALGIQKAIINLGGNIFGYGIKSDTSGWQIGIQSPFGERSTYVGVVEANNITVVTSGPYERNFVENGIRYHHILNPDTGFPVDNELESVTIIGPSSIDADALSTTVFALGIEKGLALVRGLENTTCILITKDKKIYQSDPQKDHFTLTDNSFELVK